MNCLGLVLLAALFAPSNQQFIELADFFFGNVLRSVMATEDEDRTASRRHPDIGRSTVCTVFYINLSQTDILKKWFFIIYLLYHFKT